MVGISHLLGIRKLQEYVFISGNVVGKALHSFL
jgi:hypothetical protein